MRKQVIECIPNFSEGNNMNIIKQITNEIESVSGIKLLHMDAGKAANRTVVTFVGSPEDVIEAAYRAIKKASELIDMRNQKGTHPRIGATDVCPLVPITNISMEETIIYAHKLSKKIGEELGIPVYCYEFAANEEKRKNLANCRSGEYEGLFEKLKKPEWKPDYGTSEFNETVAKSGATAVSARNLLIAYNVNLNSTSVRLAKDIASEIREKGRVKREGDSIDGKIITDDKGTPIYEPGMLKCVKGIGWYIEEYGITQLSFNLTNISITSIHHVFDLACERAIDRGFRVTGSELVGLTPIKALLDAGKHYLIKQNQSTNISNEAIIMIAIKTLGLDELAPFDPKKKIIEYLLKSY